MCVCVLWIWCQHSSVVQSSEDLHLGSYGKALWVSVRVRVSAFTFAGQHECHMLTRYLTSPQVSGSGNCAGLWSRLGLHPGDAPGGELGGPSVQETGWGESLMSPLPALPLHRGISCSETELLSLTSDSRQRLPSECDHCGRGGYWQTWQIHHLQHSEGCESPQRPSVSLLHPLHPPYSSFDPRTSKCAPRRAVYGMTQQRLPTMAFSLFTCSWWQRG